MIRLAVALMRGGADHRCTSNCQGTPGGSAIIVCPTCEGEREDCLACQGRGQYEFFGCEYSHITPMVWEFIRVSDLIEKGGWPNGHGWANEPAALVDGVQFVWRELKRA